MCVRFVCQYCAKSVDSWDEGNPYYFDDTGTKRYAYHPDPQRDFCVGVESPHLCLSCGELVTVDSEGPTTSCPACSSHNIVATFDLDGQVCPSCKLGVFARDPDFLAIS